MNENKEETLNVYRNPVEPNKKKKKGKTIIIVILVLIILGLGGYLIYDKFFAKEDVKEPETKKEEKKEELKEDLNGIAEGLVTTIEEDNVWLIIGAKNYPSSITFDNKLIDNEVLTAALTAVGNCLNNRSCSSLPVETLDNYFKDNFGITNVDYQTIICPVDKTPIYKYDSLTKEYSFTGEHPHDGLVKGSEPMYTKVIGIEKENGNYVLTVTNIYANMRDNEFISADPTGTVKIADFETYLNNDGDINTNKIISDYENNFETKKASYPKYKYTFKKDNNNYYLTKYEVIK